ncbi:MAG: ATP-dependent Clp protease ATP-binding subunit [Ardenticatenales bacterium]|nr:ATP-dependent Clp protease ATP-binding subunit [Ardenticatenales bacterium]
MSTLNPNIPTPELARLMTSAAAQRQNYGVDLLTPQLLLHTFMSDRDAAAYRILQELAQKAGFKFDELVQRADVMARYTPGRDARFDFTDDFGKQVPLSEEMLVVLDEGLSIAQARDELKVNSGHALAAMTDVKVTTYGALQRLGITQPAVLALLDNVVQDSAPLITDFLEQAKQGEAEPLFSREKLLRDLLTLLALSQKRHVILVGAEGAGKRTLVYSLAQLLAEGKGPDNLRSVVQINEAALLENPLAALRAGLRRASGGILLVPGIERFFANRLRARFPEQVNRDLHKAILQGEQVIIGTATVAEYDLLTQEALVRERMHRLDVPPASREEAGQILLLRGPRLEEDYGLIMTADARDTAVSLADQYLKGGVLPSSAIQLLERACALVKMVTAEHMETLYEVPADGRVDSDDVKVAASLISKIPLNKLSEDESSRYANIVQHLGERIIGQEEAVMAISRAVKTARVGLRSPKRPIGSFLFLGPSGVGKSELAKALAEFMFGSEEAMLTLDMSEYQEEASVNRLIGAPPGYIGFEGGGQLTNFVRERPYTVVLFDEVEKAHQRVFDVLLQVMDEGRLTDNQGRIASFSEAVIIMTSNLGSEHLLVPVIGEREREQVMREVRHFFRPEFLNRLDDVIIFHQLNQVQLALILDLMLKKEFQLASQQGLQLNLTPAAKAWLLAQNDQPEFGARPLRRIIARHLREPLADFLLRGSGGKAAHVRVDANANGLTFDMQP